MPITVYSNLTRTPVDRRLDDQVAAPTVVSRSSNTVLVLAVIAAALVRMGWAYRHGLALEQEGVEYVRIDVVFWHHC